MADKNKIKYGLTNVHFAKLTFDAQQQKYTYATPIRFPGAVSLSLDPTGSKEPFYADDIVYSQTETNTGLEGDFEVARVIDDFRKEILGATYDAVKKRWKVNADDISQEFALLFEFSGDKSKTRYVFYRCSADRPGVSGSTKEETATPETETLALTAMPRENDHEIYNWVEPDSPDYDTWYTEVKEPDAAVTTYTEEELNAMSLTELTAIAEVWDIDTSEITTKADLVAAILAAQKAAA